MMSQVNFSVNREYFSTTNQQRLTVPVANFKSTPIQKKGSLIFDPVDNTLYCSTGATWNVLPVGVVVLSVNSGTGIDVDNTDPENPVVSLAVIPDGTILGNNTGGATAPQDLSGTEVTALLNLFTSSLKGLAPASGGGTVNYLRADGTWAAPPGSGSGTVTNIATNNGVTGGPITTTGTIGLAAVPANTLKGNNTGASAVPTDLTGTQVTAMLDLFTSGLKGLTPASGGGTSNFLRADGTWAAPGGGSGTVTNIATNNGVTGGPITTTGTIGLAAMPATTIKGNNTAGSAVPTDLTGTQVTAMLDLFATASTTRGLVVGSNSATTSYLRGDQTWQTPTQVTAALNVFTTSLQGVVPASGGGTTNFLRANGTWAAPPAGTVTNITTNNGVTGGPITSSGTIGLASMAANTIKGNATGIGAVPTDLTATQVTAMLNTFTTSLKGLAPPSGGGVDNYLRADGTWAMPPGTAAGASHFAIRGTATVNSGVTAYTTPAAPQTFMFQGDTYYIIAYIFNISAVPDVSTGAMTPSPLCSVTPTTGSLNLEWGWSCPAEGGAWQSSGITATIPAATIGSNSLVTFEPSAYSFSQQSYLNSLQILKVTNGLNQNITMSYFFGY
jgi:hypothetical protein